MNDLPNWIIGIAGSLIIAAIQFFMIAYFKRFNRMREERDQETKDLLKQILAKVDTHNVDIALMKDKVDTHESRVNDHAKRIRELEQKIN